MKKTVFAVCIASFIALLPACVSTNNNSDVPMSTSVPESGTKCGYPVERWVCSYATPSTKPAGWYTPSRVIPTGKRIYRSCRNECVLGYNPVTGGCMGYAVVFDERPNHANDIVISGGRRAYCGTSSSHASEYYTLP